METTLREDPKFLSKLRQWAISINNQSVVDELLTTVEQGLDAFMDYIKVSDSNIAEYMSSFVEYIESQRKNRSSEEIIDELAEYGLSDLWVKKLVFEVENTLQFYLDSAPLRNANFTEFTNITQTVIRDIYVERKYRDPNSASSYLSDLDPDEAVMVVRIIKGLIGGFYNQNVSFEDLKSVGMTQLGLDQQKINTLIQIIEKYEEQIERYCLFQQLAEIRKGLDQISSGTEQVIEQLNKS